MRAIIFASSSSGNCLAVSHGGTHILIDAGISMRRIVASAAQAGLTMGNIGGVLITHEHSDHVSGLKTLLKNFPVELYAPHTVANRIMGMLPDAMGRTHIIPVGERFTIGELLLTAFHTSHDTDESVGYRIDAGEESFAVATDTGRVTDEMLSVLTGANAVLIEANHDVQRLLDGPYPPYLKRRILADTGHLSNADCAVLARTLVQSGTRQVILGHLSRTNNTPQLALDTVAPVLDGLGAELLCAPELGYMEIEVGECCLCSR